MWDVVARWLFDPSGLTPHGFCLFWQPGLIWTHAAADIVIGLAYFAIPVALAVIVRNRHDLVFRPVSWLFCSFILLCGAGHWLDLVTLWVPLYGVTGVVKAVTALVSIVTAVALCYLLPQLLMVNDALRTDILRSKENEAVLRAARDEANAAARAKSEFLATMSHEIRSPMSGLVGVIELLRETRLDPDQTRMANIVRSSAHSLLAVLNDILDFSKIEGEALSIVSEPTKLRELVEDLAAPHIIDARRKGVELRVVFGPAIPDHVDVDPQRLRQILNNLLGNAVKFTAAGEIGLSVDVAEDGPAPRLRFIVRDTGIGMGAEVIARLFTPFMQANASTSRDFGGTGLGLCISHRLAGLLKGNLVATSGLGEGSVFTLSVPLTPSLLPVASGAPAALANPRSLPKAGRVLVVDDDPNNRWLSQRQLTLLGLTVEVAEHGAVAFEMLGAGGFDLLLTDCHMPQMDGVALAKAVRASPNPALRNLPIVGLTADVTGSQRERCNEAGMNELAIKPLSRDELARVLSRYLPDATTPAVPDATTPAVPDATVSAAPDATTPAVPDATVSAAPEQPSMHAAGSFDDAIYRDLFTRGDPEGETWLMDFLGSAEDLVERIRQLLVTPAETGDQHRAVAATAHRLVGAALSVGAVLLAKEARSLEHAAPLEDIEHLRSRHTIVTAAMARTKQAISAFTADARVGASA